MDRNGVEIDGVSYDVWSLSARRAWIEISKILYCGTSIGLSLSARRAWIEILYGAISKVWACCRSPQGERG